MKAFRYQISGVEMTIISYRVIELERTEQGKNGDRIHI